MKTSIFLAALPSNDHRVAIAQKVHLCEAKRSPLVRVQWVHAQDLHLTIGYMKDVVDTDIRKIAVAMSEVAKYPPFIVNIEEVRLFGNAIVLRVEPYQALFNMHKKLNQKLGEACDNKYHFAADKRYDPHVTIGRIQNLQALNNIHKQQFISLLSEQFRQSFFMVQQAALLHHITNKNGPVYQLLQNYSLLK